MPFSINLKNTCFVIIFATIFTVNILRFVDLEGAPKGFYIDEIASAVCAQSIATQGTDIFGRKWPLFFFLGFGSPKPPTQIYPMAVWTKVFGISIASIRGFEAFAYTIGLIGIFLLARLLGGSTCAWLALLASSISPWGWMFSRIAFESNLGPIFLIWGIFCFLQGPRWWNGLMAGFLVACAMYSYPPTRLHAPLVILLLIGFQMKQKQLSYRSIGAFLISLFLCSAPLVYYSLQSSMQSHFKELSISSQASSMKDLTVIFTKNYLSHFSPQYLFFTGDNNYRHSTRHFGELSWLDMLGILSGMILLFLLFKDRKAPPHLVIFLILAAAAGIIPAALTNEGIPHSLRSIGSQPFIEILIGFCLAKIIERWPQAILAASLTAAIFAYCFLNVYFRVYPTESADAFMSGVKDVAEHCQSEEDWIKFSGLYPEIVSRYYMIRNVHKPFSS